jgi:hypothetical protein
MKVRCTATMGLAVLPKLAAEGELNRTYQTTCGFFYVNWYQGSKRACVIVSICVPFCLCSLYAVHVGKTAECPIELRVAEIWSGDGNRFVCVCVCVFFFYLFILRCSWSKWLARLLSVTKIYRNYFAEVRKCVEATGSIKGIIPNFVVKHGNNAIVSATTWQPLYTVETPGVRNRKYAETSVHSGTKATGRKRRANQKGLFSYFENCFTKAKLSRARATIPV